jgi:hypothetical protein
VFVPFAISEYSIWKMAGLKEQLFGISCFNLGKNSTETFEKFTVAIGEQVVRKIQLFGWFLKFRSGGITV